MKETKLKTEEADELQEEEDLSWPVISRNTDTMGEVARGME